MVLLWFSLPEDYSQIGKQFLILSPNAFLCTCWLLSVLLNNKVLPLLERKSLKHIWNMSLTTSAVSERKVGDSAVVRLRGLWDPVGPSLWPAAAAAVSMKPFPDRVLVLIFRPLAREWQFCGKSDKWSSHIFTLSASSLLFCLSQLLNVVVEFGGWIIHQQLWNNQPCLPDPWKGFLKNFYWVANSLGGDRSAGEGYSVSDRRAGKQQKLRILSWGWSRLRFRRKPAAAGER